MLRGCIICSWDVFSVFIELPRKHMRIFHKVNLLKNSSTTTTPLTFFTVIISYTFEHRDLKGNKIENGSPQTR